MPIHHLRIMPKLSTATHQPRPSRDGSRTRAGSQRKAEIAKQDPRPLTLRGSGIRWRDGEGIVEEEMGRKSRWREPSYRNFLPADGLTWRKGRRNGGPWRGRHGWRNEGWAAVRLGDRVGGSVRLIHLGFISDFLTTSLYLLRIKKRRFPVFRVPFYFQSCH